METNKTMASAADDILHTVFADKDNSRFGVTENGFLHMEADLGEGRKEYGRVVLHRAFPFGNTDSFISVLTVENEELCVIRSLDDLDPESEKYCAAELENKYFIPEVKRIKSIVSKFGYTYWICDTPIGEISFTVADTFKSLIHIGSERIIIIDVDGGRYEIKSLSMLDRKSRRLIEIYL